MSWQIDLQTITDKPLQFGRAAWAAQAAKDRKGLPAPVWRKQDRDQRLRGGAFVPALFREGARDRGDDSVKRRADHTGSLSGPAAFHPPARGKQPLPKVQDSSVSRPGEPGRSICKNADRDRCVPPVKGRRKAHRRVLAHAPAVRALRLARERSSLPLHRN